MVLGGVLSSECTSDKCKCTSLIEPLEVPCLSCSGAGCGECADGWIKVLFCPKFYTPRHVLDFIDRSDDYRRGVPPIAGGALDQSHEFLRAHSFFRGELQRHTQPSSPIDALWQLQNEA